MMDPWPLWAEVALSILVETVLLSLAFVAGAWWHSAHLCAGCERDAWAPRKEGTE